MIASAMQKIFTFTRNAVAISPNESVKIWRLKKACLNSGQPAELTTMRTIAPKKTIELATATATARPPLPPTFSPPRILELRSPSSAELLEERGAAREPGALEPLERSVRPHRRERLVHAGDERVALLEDEAEVLLLPLRGQAPDHDAVRHLDGGDVARAREVDDETVDLPVLERRHPVVERVVHLRLVARLDVADDVGVAHLPLRALRRIAAPPGRERGVVGADRELPGVEKLEVRRGAGTGQR